MITAIDLEAALNATGDAVDEVNLTLPDGEHISDDPDAVLFGNGSGLDSISLVNVVMAWKPDLTGQDVVLASAAAMSRKNSLYRSLQALAEYAVEISSEAA